MASYDNIIDEIGGFGWWQLTILLVISIPDIFCAFALILPVFTGATPEFDCQSTEDSWVFNDTTTSVRDI